jgi:hypothetical protein
MAILCAAVILGTNTPLSLLCKSSRAELLGVAVPIPTDCAGKLIQKPNKNSSRNNKLFNSDFIIARVAFLCKVMMVYTGWLKLASTGRDAGKVINSEHNLLINLKKSTTAFQKNQASKWA